MSEKKARVLRINPFEECRRVMQHELRMRQQSTVDEAEACEKAINTLMPLIEELPVTNIRSELSSALTKLQEKRVTLVMSSQVAEVSSKAVYKTVVKSFVDKNSALTAALKNGLPSAEDCLKMASVLEGTTRDFVVNLHANLQAFDPVLYNNLTARVASPDHTVYDSPSGANGEELKSVPQGSALLKPVPVHSVPFQAVKPPEDSAKPIEASVKPIQAGGQLKAAPEVKASEVKPANLVVPRRVLTTAEHRAMAQSRAIMLHHGQTLIKCMKTLMPAKVVFRVPNDRMNYHYDGEIVDVVIQRYEARYGVLFFFRFGDRIGSFGEFLHYVIKQQESVVYPSRDKLVTVETPFATIKLLVSGQWKKIYEVFPKTVLNLADEAVVVAFIEKMQPPDSKHTE